MTNGQRPAVDEPSKLVFEKAVHDSGGRLTAAISVVALLLSGYSLWDSSLRAPDIKAFVPSVIQYSSPYNNSNFEVFEVPVTLINDGGRTGTVLSMELAATNDNSHETKRFYAADLGRWTMDKARANGFLPFAPISLAGKASRTETVLFYTDGPGEKPEQLVRQPGTFTFTLMLDEAGVRDFGILDRLMKRSPVTLSFQMQLREFDGRAFQNGTLPLYATTGRPASSDKP